MTYPDDQQPSPSTPTDIDLSHIPPPVFPSPKRTVNLPVKKILLWSGIALAGAGLVYGINSIASQKNKSVAQSLKKKEQERKITQQLEQDQLYRIQTARRFQTEKERNRNEHKRQEQIHQQPDYTPHRQAVIETRPLSRTYYKQYKGSAAFSPDGNYLLTQVPFDDEQGYTHWGCRTLSTANFLPVGETVKIHDKKFTLSKYYEDISAAAYTPDQSALLLIAAGNAVFYNFRTKDISAPIREFVSGSETIDFSSDGKYVALTTTSKVTNEMTTFIALHDANTGKKLHHVCLGKGTNHYVEFLPQGDRLLTKNSDRAELIGVRTGRTLWSSPSGTSIQDARMHPDGRMIALLCDRELSFWSTETGELMPIQPQSRIRAQLARAESCLFSPDGTRLLIASYTEVVILDTATGKPVGTSMEHEAPVATACFTPNGRYVITSRKPLNGIRAEEPCEVQIWETETGNKFGQPMKHDSAPVYMEVSKDGKYLLTQESDETGQSQIWNISKTAEQPET